MAAWTLPAMILDWCEFVTTALDRRSRKYFFNIILGMILRCGRRTVSCWLRSGDVSEDWQDHYYFLQTLGRSARNAWRHSCFIWRCGIFPSVTLGNLSNSQSMIRPRSRYGKKVELAGKHHNPTPGPSGAEFLFGHVWVTISWLVRHPQWGCIGLPLLARMYVRQKDLEVMENVGKAPWKFRTKLELAAGLVEWCVRLFQNWFRRRVLVVADGAYAKRPFLQRVLATGAVVVSRPEEGCGVV
jgi:hypothetical protein